MFWMQIYGDDGFKDEFESNVISKLLRRIDCLQYIKIEDEKEYYNVRKRDIEKLLEPLKQEYQMQRQKCLFKDKGNKTLKELKIIIGILKIISEDTIIKDNEYVVTFIIKDKVELLDI